MKHPHFFPLSFLFPVVAVCSAILATTAKGDITYRLELEIDGVTLAQFQEVSGLSVESEIIEHMVVNPDGSESTMKIPGRTKYSNIVLKRGVTRSGELWEWRKQVVEGDPDARKNGAIIVYDSVGSEVARYNFINGWPSKWSLDANTSIAIEEIVIVVETVDRL